MEISLYLEGRKNDSTPLFGGGAGVIQMLEMQHQSLLQLTVMPPVWLRMEAFSRQPEGAAFPGGTIVDQNLVGSELGLPHIFHVH